MVDVVPFPCVRPSPERIQEVASLPYDVFSLTEAQAEIAKHPLSFLRIDMPEATLPSSLNPSDDTLFKKTCSLFTEALESDNFLADDEPYYYLYRLCVPGKQSQTGVVGCSSIDDYLKGSIKKHENTRAEKELDRIRHVDACNAHTGPILLAFRSDGRIEEVIERSVLLPPLYDFTADDGVQHTIWQVKSADDTALIRQVFADTSTLYIADGHHRAAAAAKVGLLRRKKAQGTCTTQKETKPALSEPTPAVHPLASDHFLSIIFPHDQLTILDYNRVVADLNGLTPSAFIEEVRERFSLSGPQETPVKPGCKGTFGMYVEGKWYTITALPSATPKDPVSLLDVSILQDELLGPLLGIKDPRTDERIDFVGGIRGLEELERRVAQDSAVAFSLYPPSLEELFSVADADLLMPPKSTWFEPKPRSGIFIHCI